MKLIRIALVQMVCEKNATPKNLSGMARYLAEANNYQLDIAGFPEMCLAGYADPIKQSQAVFHLDGAEVGQLLEITRSSLATVLAGLIEHNPEPGAKPFITQLVAQEGHLLGTYRKRTVRDDEALWFSPGEMSPIFNRGSLTYGIAICADIADENVFADLARQGAQIVFELAAPGLYGEQASRNWQSGFDWWKEGCQKNLGAYAEKYKIWIAVATQAGRTADEDFPGGGYVFARDGRCLYATPDWSPGAVYLELDLEGLRVSLLGQTRE